MKDLNYLEFCDKLLSDWRENKIVLQDNYGFDLDALPEPYLTFGSKSDEVCFLTNNPGSVMEFQKKNENFSPISESYNNLSKRLGQHYEDYLSGVAKTRILNMYEISNTLFPTNNSFMQLEISPFHSSSFPNKEKFSKNILRRENDIHTEYINNLTAFLSQKNCICIQSGFPDLKRLNKNWISLIGNILSIKSDTWNLIEFKIKNERATTGAFYYKGEKFFKVILFNSASNSCPRINTMTELFKILKS